MKKLLLIFSIFTITTLPATATPSGCNSEYLTLYERFCKDGIGGLSGIVDSNRITFSCNEFKTNIKTEDVRTAVKKICPNAQEVYVQRFIPGLLNTSQLIDITSEYTTRPDGSQWTTKQASSSVATKNIETGELITVTGTVLDENNKPLYYATVGILNTETGTYTDENGNFTLTNVPENAELLITNVGFKNHAFTASTAQQVITLERDVYEIDETVVTGCSNKPNDQTGHTTQQKIGDNCYPTGCISPRWKLSGKNENAKCVEQECKIDNGTAKWEKVSDKWECKLESCNDGYQQNDNKCKKLKQCNETDKTALENNGASKTGIKEGTNTCIALECKCGYDLNDGKCVKWDKNAPCDDKNEPKLPKNAASGKKMCDDKGKAYCEIGTCNDGFKVSENKKSCVSTRGDACDATAVDKNATAGVQKKVDGKMTCVITDCARGFKPNKDGTKCVAGELSEEDSQARINELRDNAKAMKDKEQSTANKLLGAAGIGATGIGGMQMMSAMAEEKSDADAERAMRAYLATFHCEYGGGKNIAGGKTDIELPGGNELINLYSEYVNLANDLKVRKTALDMRPGIESESILDAATSGLYDDVAVGKTTGAYTSLARALMDPTGEDAKKWQEQKQSTADQKKTGMITAGVGAAGSLIGNLAINSGDSKKNKVDEILDKYKDKKNEPVAEAGTLTENMSQAIESKDPVVTSDIPTDNLQERNIAQSIEISEGTTETLTMAVSKMFNNKNKLTNYAKTEISTLLTKIDGDACLLATEYRHDRENFDTFYPRVKELEKHLLSELSEIKDKSTQIDPTSSIIGAGECASTNNDCPKVTILLKCIKNDKIIPSDTTKTEWQKLKGNEYATLGDTIYQSSTRDTYKEYLTSAKNACKTAKGTWENKRRVFTYIPNTAGTYNTYFHPVCKFEDEDQSRGSTRCKEMCNKAKIKCTQGGAFGHRNYTSCLILAPETN